MLLHYFRQDYDKFILLIIDTVWIQRVPSIEVAIFKIHFFSVFIDMFS